ncbi:RHS repeat-associated core domain-containing protein [Synechococcus sp. PCC 7336]|uniref:RHS repeat-associated core domain-containing protein n=1 Tax=Synechococcus sp. PCC 7336 TaxID=195250 RepID=UPI000345E809
MGRTTRFGYDALDRQTRITDALGNSTLFGYDAVGNLTSQADALGNTTRFVYDELNREIATIDPLGFTTTSTYTAVGTLASITDASGNTTTYEYDVRDLLVRETNQLGDSRSYNYDEVGNLTSLVDRNGRQTAYSYDSLDRLTQERFLDDAGTAVEQIDYTYDAASQLIGISDFDSSYTYRYDAAGRLTRSDNTGTAGIPTFTLDYTYDAVGNRLSVTDSIDAVETGVERFTYDSLDRVIDITQTGAAVSDKRVSYTYDAASQLIGVETFNDLAGTQVAIATTHSFDAAGRLANITHTDAGGTVLADYTYSFDAANRITAIQSLDGLSSFSYDASGQQLEGNFDFQTDESFSFDATGNRTNTGNIVGPNNQLLEDENFTYAYDAEGNRTQRTDKATGEVTQYEYDHRNRLTSAITLDSSGNETGRAEYTYDALDRRIGRTVEGQTERYLYDGSDIALVTYESGEVTQRFLHSTSIDRVVAQEDGAGNVLYALSDHQNTVRDIADSTGTVVNHLTFDSFGNITSQSDASVEFRFSFTGREFDEETGLYYFRARYLDPSTGQFISQDPIGFAAGDVNLYRYVGNSPLNFIDPSGNQAESPLQFNLSVESGSTIPQATINELRDRSNEIAEGSKTSLPETTINQTLARAREIAELRATEFSPVNPEPVSFDERTSVSPSAEAPEPPIAEAPEQPTLTPEPIIDEGADIIITQDDLPPRAPSPNQGTELSNSEHNPVPEPAVDEPEAEINEPEEPLPPRDPRPNRPRDPRRRVGPFVVSPDAVNGTDGPDVAGIQSTTSSTPGNTDSLASSPLFDSTPNPIAPLTAIDAFNNSSQALVTGAIVGGLALAAAPVTAAVVGVTLAVAVFGFSLRRRSQQAASLGRSQSVVDGSTLVGPLGRSEVETQLRVFTGAVGDITGVTQLIQGVTGRDFVTGATLSTQQRSEDLGTGVLSTATEVVGLITTADEVVRTFTANSRNSGPIRLSNSREVASESALGDAAEGIFPLVPGRRADNGALSDLDLSELTALRGAGLSDGEIARQLQLLGGTPLFRGTTRDFPGNPILQRLGISPASTDPLVATVFALEGKARGGDPIVLFGNAQDFGSPDINLGNVRRTLEREVAVGMSPSDFARNAPNSISADRARQILSELGVADLPPSIGSVQEATQILENTPRLTPEQILEFTRRAAN